MPNALRWYLANVGSFLIPAGINMVLFPSLVAVYLHESAERVGIAQMAGQLPMLLLILVGGLLGDRFDQRRILFAVHLFASLPPLLLATAIGLGELSYALLIVYAVSIGVMQAISQPTRDALLSRVAGAQIQRTVIVVMGAQFAMQILGFGAGSLAGSLGPVPVLMVHALVMVLGAFAVLRIAVPPLTAPVARPHPLRAIAEGFAFVVHSPRLFPVTLLTFGVGLFFAGTFVVLIPLSVRDIYGGGPAEIALAFFANMVGTVLMTALLFATGGIVHQGRALVVALLGGCMVLLPLCFGVPELVFYAMIFLWGLGAGVAMTMSRTIAQESAPESHRARVMSVFSLGAMGGMPLGSLMMGYAASFWGPAAAVWLPVIGMAVLTIAVVATTDVWRALPQRAEAQV